MSQVTETICDQCGARKGKGNHWFKLEQGSDWLTISVNNGKSQVGQDLCSEGCVTRCVDEFLGKQRTTVNDEELQING